MNQMTVYHYKLRRYTGFLDNILVKRAVFYSTVRALPVGGVYHLHPSGHKSGFYRVEAFVGITEVD